MLLAAAFAAVAAIGVGVGYGLSRGSSDKASAPTTEPTTSSAPSPAAGPTTTTAEPGGLAPPTTISTDGLDPTAAELATAINKASSLTYHAVYTGTRTSSAGDLGQIRVEVWHALPLARRDTLITNAKGSVHTEELRLTDKLTGCFDTSLGSGTPSWTCVPTAGRGVDPADPILGVARPVSGMVTARDDTVGSVAVRCFTVTTSTKAQEACFDADGIPAAIDGGDGRIERSELGRGVDPSTIVLPAGATEAPAGSVTTTTVT